MSLYGANDVSMDESTDIELWERAVAGEPAAFGVLFERHARAIYNYLFRRCADWSLAEDLTSVVFLEAYRRRATVVIEEGKVLPWLYGVATNVLRNQRRSTRRYAEALRRLSPPEALPGAGADAADRIDAERQMRSVLAVLERLPKADRDVLALCVWSELSYEDAAVALGVPIGTVRSRLSRARARLAELAALSGHVPDVPSTKGVCES
jgi:RNA polymerase sigma factor (sigma-70 family)